jgi:hypothetical protein
LRWVAFKAGIPSPEEEKQALVVIGFFGMLERGAENGIMACTTNTYVVIREFHTDRQTVINEKKEKRKKNKSNL